MGLFVLLLKVRHGSLIARHSNKIKPTKEIFNLL
jgi:hypothetical protein